MVGPLVVVKLGGSVITRKRGPARVRHKVLRRLAEELHGPATPPLLVLHGAGSFGHPGAVRFGLARAPVGPPTPRARGAAIVGREVRELHQAVLGALVDAGGHPVSVPPFPIAQNRAGAFGRIDLNPVTRALESGATPVSFGDVVPDSEWGFSILSADTIAVAAARALDVSRVVFVSDVDGVWTPGSTGRRPIVETLDRTALDRLTPAEGVPDVTGGIRGKVEAMLQVAAAGVDAVLISGLRDGALCSALTAPTVYGSWARASAKA